MVRKTLLALLLAGALVPPWAAATLMSAQDVWLYQDQGFSYVSLSTQPGALARPTNLDDSNFWLDFGFVVDHQPDGDMTADIFLNNILQQSFKSPLISNESPGNGRVIYTTSMSMGECCFKPQPGHVDVRMTGFDDRSYDFQLVQPVPEPAPVVLLLSGLALMLLARRFKCLGFGS